MTQYELKMFCNGCSEYSQLVASLEEAVSEAGRETRKWVRDGDWGTDGARVDYMWTLSDEEGEEELAEGSGSVEIEPWHGSLIRAATGGGCGDDPDDHDWSSAGEGGCDQNPGVFSVGGTSMTFSSHCRTCGLHRTENVTGSQYNPGQSDTVEYRMLDEEEIAGHRAYGSMDEFCE